jgi:hypothetical protein
MKRGKDIGILRTAMVFGNALAFILRFLLLQHTSKGRQHSLWTTLKDIHSFRDGLV